MLIVGIVRGLSVLNIWVKCEEAVGGLPVPEPEPEPELEPEPDPELVPDLVESGVGGGVGPGVGGSAVGSNTMLIEKDSKISRSTADTKGLIISYSTK